MQDRSTHSSLHYDPHANLLCVLRGRKVVRLYHPSQTPHVYPLPLWGQSSNHSAVDAAEPDLARHPLWQRACRAEQRFVLQVTVCDFG